MVASHDYRFMRFMSVHAVHVGSFARSSRAENRKCICVALDVTIIKLLDGTRTYLHAIIDNYSRRILSWTLETRLGSSATCRVLRDAAKEIVGNISRTSVGLMRVART